MKTFGTVLKILAALAAIAGVVYIVMHYGDKIAAWAKRKLARFGCCMCDEPVIDFSAEEAVSDESAEEPPVQAEETDFES